MKKFLVIYMFMISAFQFAQQLDLKSPENIKHFADYLFCEKDYLRAVNEYEKCLLTTDNDSIQFKIAYAFLEMGKYESAIKKFTKIKPSSFLFEASKIEKLKSYFLLNDSTDFMIQADSIFKSDSPYKSNALKLKSIAVLLSSIKPDKNEYLKSFNLNERKDALSLYDKKLNPGYKSEILSGILSALVPGAGKIYTENYSDGITTLLLTGIFGYLAYTNFDHHHNFRAWIFSAVATGFYAGNIYGSIASAQIFNAKINFDFANGVRLFLQNNNYFSPNYDLCK